MTDGDRHGWPRVLVVEDDESQILGLRIGLERERFAVTAVREGEEAVEEALRLRPDVILLDVVLSGMSGIDVCRELRARGLETPIIFVSSRAEEVDVVVGIEVGADDYVVKPYRLRELVARIGALLRRNPTQAAAPTHDSAAPPPAERGVLVAGDVVLDGARHEVLVRGERVELPLREFQVLQTLLRQAGRVVTRDALLAGVWGLDFDGDPRIVATLIGRLRARIEPVPERPVHITTIRGVGYRFNKTAT